MVASKPFAARQLEARGRARALGVRVTVVEPGRRYQTPSQSQPGVVYTVIRTGHGWTCDCEGFRYTGLCKHIAQVERRSERENWPFGRIAPRPQPAPLASGVPA